MPGSPSQAAPRSAPASANIARRAAERLRRGGVWVYHSDIERLRPAPGEDAVAAGSLITVLDERGAPLGSALYSAASQITLRLVSRHPGLTRQTYLAEVAQRVRNAVVMRQQLSPVSPQNNARRLIFSEADALPGIVADQYNDIVVLQLLTQGTSQPDVRHAVTAALQECVPGIATVVERPDPRIQAVEALDTVPGEPVYADRENPLLLTTFTINGIAFAYDAQAGQKTGAFLDQRLNYKAAAAAAAVGSRSAALDICTYQGGFALHLAQVCARVTGVDASRAALEVADANLELNPHLPARVDWIEADAFELLREFEATRQRFGTIVLDPPAFAKSKRAAEGALRGYKELNLRALKMLEPGGLLVTCSCSQHVGLPDFLAVVTAAADDARRTVQLLETRGAAPDHPAILSLPETAYLKCLICRAE